VIARAAAGLAMAARLDRLSRSDFEQRLLATFRLPPGLPVSEIVLIEARSLGEPAGSRRAPFSILFRGPREPVLAQSIYRLDESELGTIEIFLVPIGPDAQGMVYEAVFN
jgi:hypothetical protein